MARTEGTLVNKTIWLVVLCWGAPLAASAQTIYGSVDPTTLGNCTSAIHDRFVVDGGDGRRYRTWHPQVVTVNGFTCAFAHEHGDNPARMTEASIAAVPVRFGFVARRAGMDEPHEGFKVFVVNRGDVNNENRTSRLWSRAVFHMGTGGPGRFAQDMHSAEVRLVHPEFGLKAFTQLMMSTGGVHTVCNPRAAAPTKDVVSLKSPCRLASAYEIWSAIGSVVRKDGTRAYRAFATPAVFDPITAFNPANPGETVYIWDARLNPVFTFALDRSGFRGCSRESYAAPGYWYNAGRPTVYLTDTMGHEVSPGTANALVQEISAANAIGVPATNDGLKSFKRRVSYCQYQHLLGVRN